MQACQRFVDEECARIQQPIPHRQVPPASNGHAQRGEIPWRDRAQLNLRTLVTWPAGDVEIADPAPVLQRHHLRETGRLHTWQLRNAIGDGEVVVVGNARRQVNRQHVVGDHSRIGAFETAELTDHAGDAKRQHECQCNLDDDEPIAHPAEDQGARRTATRGFRDVLRVRPRDHHGRRQAKHHRDDDAHGQQERERGPVEPDFVRSRDFGGADPDEKVERPARDDNAGHAAREREQQALDEELADEPTRTRAERGTRDHFVRARGRASEEQVGDVGARGGQHQSDSAHQQPERLVNLAEHIVGERHQLNAKRPVRPGCGHIQPFLDGIELGGGGADADACLHASSEVAESSPVRAAVRYPYVCPELGLRPGKGSGGAVGKLKCVRHDADHREFTPFDHRAALNRVPSIPAQGNRCGQSRKDRGGTGGPTGRR